MSHLFDLFKNKKTYIAYVTAGDGGMKRTYEAASALIEGGVDILEIGVPFSDPMADGPVIQQASFRALSQKITMDDIFKLIRKLKSHTKILIILFSYFNPILAAGADFYTKAKQAGVDGCLIVDLPLEESNKHCQACKTVDLDPILLIAPSTPTARIKKINQQGKGFLYYVCREGTTGIKSSLPKNFVEKITEIKSITTLPVVAGFGISNHETAKKVLNYTDGFVVGSLFVDAIAKGIGKKALKTLAKSIDPREIKL